MCEKISDISTDAVGTFLKGNESMPMTMKIKVSPCACGSKWFAKVAGNSRYVECSPVDESLAIEAAIERDAFPDK